MNWLSNHKSMNHNHKVRDFALKLHVCTKLYFCHYLIELHWVATNSMAFLFCTNILNLHNLPIANAVILCRKIDFSIRHEMRYKLFIYLLISIHIYFLYTALHIHEIQLDGTWIHNIEPLNTKQNREKKESRRLQGNKT